MQYYKNLSGGSGIRAYVSNSTQIAVQFSDGAVYVYSYQSAGSHNIEHMKRLADAGSGLNSFINTHVKYRYAYKHR